MYAPLLITIILAILFIPALLWVALPYPLYCKYDKKCHYIDENGNKSRFYGSGYQEKVFTNSGRKEEFERLKKYDKKKDFWYKQWGNREELRTTILVTVSIILAIFLLVTIIVPLCARDEVVYWEEFAPMAQNIINNADSAQSVAIAGDISEYNKWLADARASQKTYGSWSAYHFIDLSNLQYITVN